MKKLLNLCVTSLLAVSPSLWADPLAGHTLLTSLPRDATLLLKKEITLAKPIGKDFFFFYRVSKNTEFDLTRGVWVRCKNKRALNATQAIQSD